MNNHPHSIPPEMKSPRDRRPSSYLGGIIQLHVTRACNLACCGCTQGSNLGGKTTFIPPNLFEQAVVSLVDHWGVVGVFGGCPNLHPQFPLLCEILRRHIPKKRCGLWSNNLNGHGAVCRETFNPHFSNLNVHLDREAYDEMKRDWPECRPVGLESDSRHSPPYVALQDVVPDEAERWRLIARCDVNQYWSAMVCLFRGELRGYFCELAGAQAMLHQHEPDYPDLGVPVVPGWWDRPMTSGEFADQARFHCHACGIPLRGLGELAVSGDAEQVSRTHAAIFRPKRPGRLVELVTTLEQVRPAADVRATDYLEKGRS